MRAFLCRINFPQQFDGSFDGRGHQDIHGWAVSASINLNSSNYLIKNHCMKS
jgi:hypothetical protein